MRECAPVKCADDTELAGRMLNEIKGKTLIGSLEDWANSTRKIQHGQMQEEMNKSLHQHLGSWQTAK